MHFSAQQAFNCELRIQASSPKARDRDPKLPSCAHITFRPLGYHHQIDLLSSDELGVIFRVYFLAIYIFGWAFLILKASAIHQLSIHLLSFNPAKMHENGPNHLWITFKTHIKYLGTIYIHACSLILLYYAFVYDHFYLLT